MFNISQMRRRDASPRLVLIIVCAGVVLASVDLFIVNVALPDIARDLHARGLGGLSWVLNAYAIVYAALLVLLGRLADRYERATGFLVGVALFTAASAACAAAGSVGELVAFRVLQAAGAALLTPTSLGLVLASAPPERRHGAVRAWTAVGGLAAALGPVAGGLLVALSWRWVFLVNVPIGLAALVVGARRLPVVPGHATRVPDPLGAALVTAGVALLTLGLVESDSWGWGTAATVAVLAGGAAVLALFALRCARHENPLVDPALFARRSFSGASVVTLLFSTAFGAMLLSIVLWEQRQWGWSALTTGLAIAPGPLMVPLFSFLVAGRLIARLGPARVIAAGSTVFATGVASWALAATAQPDYAEVLGGMIMSGVGVGLTLPTLMATAASTLPAHAFATGSAVVNMLRQLGFALGVAALVAILGAHGALHGPAALGEFRRAWALTAAVAALGAPAALLLIARRRRAGAAPAEPLAAALGERT